MIRRETKERLLPLFLVFAGLVCLSLPALVLFWPSGWDWGTEGRHYLHMIFAVYAVLGVFLILAAKNPAQHRSLLLFAAWSSVAHGGIMAMQAVQLHQHGHLVGDVPALLVVAVCLFLLMPEKQHA